ncbi:MAG: hypothetical protein COA44_05055 [Arcobacter sp.]|nr:MAG: hypothetical protein COA44_05055 [Arcobacter sp.]
MRFTLENFLYSNHTFKQSQSAIKYKFIFLNTVYFVAALIIFVMAIVRFLQESYIISLVDMSFSAISFFILFQMRKYKDKIELFSTVLLFITYIMFTIVYIFAQTQSSRIAIFFLLVGAAYFLKGKFKGLCWIIIISSTLMGIHFFTQIQTHYTSFDLIMVIVYFAMFYYILNLYDQIKNADNKQLIYLNENLEKIVKERTTALQEAVTDLEEEKKALKVISSTDQLTGLCNRSKIRESFSNEQKKSIRYKHNLSMIIIDLDYFKRVNDSYGHSIGDEFLQAIASILKDVCRDTDLIARWGGEEFLILLPDTDIEAAQDLSIRLKKTINEMAFKDIGRQSASFGISKFKEDDSLDTLFQRADEALYRAKNKGRDRIEVSN